MGSAFDEAAVADTEARARRLEEGAPLRPSAVAPSAVPQAAPAVAGGFRWRAVSAGVPEPLEEAPDSPPPLLPGPASRLAPAPAPRAAAPALAVAAPAAPAGASALGNERVALCGLLAKPELNGQRGAVVGYRLAEDRFLVLLDDGRGPYKLKAKNLRSAPGGPAETKAAAAEASGAGLPLPAAGAAADGGAAARNDGSGEEGSEPPAAAPFAGSAKMELLRQFYTKGDPSNRRAVEEALIRATTGK
jgi:hypothetical protein